MPAKSLIERLRDAAYMDIPKAARAELCMEAALRLEELLSAGKGVLGSFHENVHDKFPSLAAVVRAIEETERRRR
jgi:hypothetical protein